jgi:hypothetical protein
VEQNEESGVTITQVPTPSLSPRPHLSYLFRSLWRSSPRARRGSSLRTGRQFEGCMRSWEGVSMNWRMTLRPPHAAPALHYFTSPASRSLLSPSWSRSPSRSSLWQREQLLLRQGRRAMVAAVIYVSLRTAPCVPPPLWASAKCGRDLTTEGRGPSSLCWRLGGRRPSRA